MAQITTQVVAFVYYGQLRSLLGIINPNLFLNILEFFRTSLNWKERQKLCNYKDTQIVHENNIQIS